MSEDKRINKNYFCQSCEYSSDKPFFECPNCKPKSNMKDAWFGNSKKQERSLLGY